MKKVLLILVLLLTSCSNKQELQYYKLVDQLKEINTSSEHIPFDIDISMSKLTEMENVYHIIIDNPKNNFKDVSVLVVHDIETENIFPSLGVVDEKIDLLANINNVEKGKIKGIALVGYLPIEIKEEINFKVMIEYKNPDNKKNTVYYTQKVTRPDN